MQQLRFVVWRSSAYGQATVTTFTDRALWEAEVGTALIVDFNEVTKDTPIHGVPFDAGLFSLLGGVESSKIDAAPFEGAPDWVIDGTTYVFAEVDDANELEMTLHTSVTAFGADFSKVDFGGIDLIVTSNVGTTVVSLPTITAIGFFGFVLSPAELISSITFVNRGDQGRAGDAFGMDNVALIPVPTIPAVGSIGLGAMILLLLGAGTVILRKRKIAVS